MAAAPPWLPLALRRWRARHVRNRAKGALRHETAALRVGEVCQLRWRSVDLHHKRLVIEQSKTDAGVREVDLSLDLLDELIA